MPVLLSYAFRPLFLLTGVYAVLAMAAWLALWSGYWRPPTGTFGPLYLHVHEMVFGVAGAAIGGFLLTAVATWTGRKPVQGAALLTLCACWLLGRVAMFASLPWLLAMSFGVSYGAVLLVLFANEVIAARNRRNYKVAGLLALLLLFDLMFWLGPRISAAAADLALRGGVMSVVVLITLIGGRITPAFTRNWMSRNTPAETPLPVAENRVDRVATTVLCVACGAWTVLPASDVTALTLIAAGIGHVLRFSRWRGLATRTNPLLFVLHVGHAWVAAGLLLLGVAILVDTLPVSTAIHALTVGAVGTMIPAVGARAALGHTGRPLQASPAMQVVFALLSVTAAVRIGGALGGWYSPSIWLSASLWIAAFAVFSWHLFPILAGPARP